MGWVALRKEINKRLGLEELKTLCFDMEVQFDDLPGTGKQAKVRELLEYCMRQKRIEDLLLHLNQVHPSISWMELYLIMDSLHEQLASMSDGHSSPDGEAIIRSGVHGVEVELRGNILAVLEQVELAIELSRKNLNKMDKSERLVLRTVRFTYDSNLSKLDIRRRNYIVHEPPIDLD